MESCTKLKVCTLCNEEKPEVTFGRYRVAKDGLRYRCKECEAKLRKSQPTSTRWRDFKSACRKNRRENLLTREEFMSFWQKPCTYCGNTTPTVNLDRLDNDVGYTIDNVAPCCIPCNRAKNTMSKEEYIEHCKNVVRFNT